jgi:methylated-DNA-[protein]-cysteine S-methyltransferase
MTRSTAHEQGNPTMPARHVIVPLEVHAFRTALGWMAFAEADEGVARLTFGQRSRDAALTAIGAKSVKQVSASGTLVDRLIAYAEGEPDTFLDVPLALGPQTNFQRKVIAACRAIPPGETRTYGQMAAKAGVPRAARAVGTVMSTNRTAILVPCHRVVAAGGRIGGYSMSGGLDCKRTLLELERGGVPANA